MHKCLHALNGIPRPWTAGTALLMWGNAGRMNATKPRTRDAGAGVQAPGKMIPSLCALGEYEMGFSFGQKHSGFPTTVPDSPARW